MKKRLFLDLDGPILDVRPRYHRLYSELVTDLGASPVALEDYWQAKRGRVPETQLAARAGLAGAQLESFSQRRAERIESEACLQWDELWPWTRSSLATLAAQAELVLVTQRSHRERLWSQLARLELLDYFAVLLSGRGDDRAEAKRGMIEDAKLAKAQVLGLVGDTEVDMKSAQALGIPSLAVLTGIRDRQHLEACQPTAIFENLAQVANWLEP